MCEDQNNVPVADIQSTGQADQPQEEANEKQKQYYLEQVRLLCPAASPDSPEKQRLWTLLRKTKRIINLLTYFDRPWEKGMPEIQKACLHFLTAEGVPRKERMEILEKWADWSLFLVGASGYRSFIIQLLNYYHHQLNDLERLVGRKYSETPDLLTD